VCERSVESATALESEGESAIGAEGDDPARLGVDLLWPPRCGAFDRQRFLGWEQGCTCTPAELVVADGPEFREARAPVCWLAH